jgi:hypothetical protein
LEKVDTKRKPTVEDYAHDILFLIANRKFCRQIVAASPVTIQAFFETMTKLNKFDIPISQFSRNISSEAIIQHESFLYVEDEGYHSGLLGYLKPVSLALYGNYFLVEGIAKNGINISLLDIHFEEFQAYDAKQWKGYCRATLFILKDYLEKGCGSQNSFTLNRAMHNIENSYYDLHKLNDILEPYNNDTFKRFKVAVKFVEDAIDLIDKQSTPPKPLPNVRETTFPKNIYDYLALLIFDIIFLASTVKSPPETCWSIYHNTVWNSFFRRVSEKSNGLKIIQFKVRRILYDEIAHLTEMPNYKGAKILGYCLNVLGTTTGSSKQNYGKESYALAKLILGLHKPQLAY